MEALMEWDHPDYTDNFSLFFHPDIKVTSSIIRTGFFCIILKCHSIKNTGMRCKMNDSY